MTNHYEVLGVNESAAQDDIKSAYRKLAMKYHPDKNPGDKSAEEQFKKVQEAYDTLSEDSKRKNYDFMRKNGYDPRGFNPRDPFSYYTSQNNDPFADFFRNANHQASIAGHDIGFNLACSFEDTIHGTRKNVTFNTNEICSSCDGEGHKKGSTKITCHNCKGSGQVVQVQNFGGGKVVQIATICPTCGGKGQSIAKENICKLCNEGLVEKKISLDVDIPANISYGTTMRLQDKGLYAHSKGNKGHCFIKIIPEKHELFEMTQEYDIVLPLYISISDAILGTKIDIPNIDGSIESVIIPEGTNHGDKIIINGKGLFNNGKVRSNMIIFIQVETPKNDEDIKDLIKKLKSMENPNILPKTENVKQKIDKYIKREKKHAKTT